MTFRTASRVNTVLLILLTIIGMWDVTCWVVGYQPWRHLLQAVLAFGLMWLLLRAERAYQRHVG